MPRAAKIARRTFLIGAAAVAGGVAIGYYSYRQPFANPLESGLEPGEATFNPFVKIASDETITIIAPRAEMGQGVSTTLAALVAEELEVDLEQVRVEHGPASPVYYNRGMVDELGPFAFFREGMLPEGARSVFGAVPQMLGVQGTGGSSSVRDAFDRMREAGAAARYVLVAAAAERLGVPARELKAAGGEVRHEASGKALTYGALALVAVQVPMPEAVELKPRAQWKLLGRSQPRTDMLAKITGAPVFGIDVRLPDMLFATVRMSPRFGAKIRRAETSKARAVAGLEKIVWLDTPYGSGFGVIARNTWAAFKAAEAIEVEWSETADAPDDGSISAALNEALDEGGGWALRDDGDTDVAFADAPAEKLLEAEYAVPYLAHACMEPMNAAAWLRGGVLDVWAGNQLPTHTRQFCADAVGLSPDKVNVHTPHLGGGFGRRAEMDFSVYAALLAKEVEGRPVKVTWTREEDIRHDYYRPAAAGRFRARLGENGLPFAVDMRIASPSIMKSMLGRLYPSIPVAGPERLLSEGAFDQPYSIPNYRVTGVPAEIGVPVGIWRSVGNSFNAFFHECFMDEIAHAGGTDPVELRRTLMADYPVALGVVDKVAEISGWGDSAHAGTAKGFAFTACFGSWVAEVVQVADTSDGIRIEKVWIAADVGRALDPRIIEAQLVSGAIFGLSAAIGQEITFAGGMVEQSNFHDFGSLRMDGCPEFETAILESGENIGGVGEIATPSAAPALANAVFALTGKRIRRLPLQREVSFA